MGGKQKLPELVSLSISAWSLKARFALKHHGIKYRTTPYTPLAGELWLRLRLCEWRRKLTVPVMFTPQGGVLMQSYDIARWADEHSARPGAEKLFPEGREEEVSSWNAKSDTVLFFGRQALVRQLKVDPSPAVPPGLTWLGPVGRSLVRLIAGRLGSKYRAEGDTTSLEKALAVLREAQAALRTAPTAPPATSPTSPTSPSGPSPAGPLRHLVAGRLTYADIAIAVATMTLKPLGPPFSNTPRGAVRELQPHLSEFADLLAWRDALFAAHYPTTTTSSSSSAAA
ncbi:hypothetical protein Agub_g9608 [Astrephomene gubernaculifera]|uniref:GST N-terminal domain-containing protein n=1 Tax=Astrephomene gubernaculifera TaxID=47775 RepID=A0AAD3DTK6_9CHLO|nr:hypothetical protein Agub_g9608 [Astrephomene gubernaculifera]